MEYMRKLAILAIIIAVGALAYFGMQRYQSHDAHENVKIQRNTVRGGTCAGEGNACSSTTPCCKGLNCNQAPAYNGTGICYKNGSAQPA